MCYIFCFSKTFLYLHVRVYIRLDRYYLYRCYREESLAYSIYFNKSYFESFQKPRVNDLEIKIRHSRQGYKTKNMYMKGIERYILHIYAYPIKMINLKKNSLSE